MENRHTAQDLAQMQNLPLGAKITMSQQRIKDWYNHWNGEVYVAFSGGKDSTVLKHLVDHTPGVYEVPAVFVNTGLEYPEIQRFVKDVSAGKYDCFNPDVEIIRPEIRFDEVIRKYGYPVVSKLVSKRVKNARSCISKGNYDAKCLQMIHGTFQTPEGNHSRYNCSKWEYLLDAPFPISHQCCDVMKKRPAHAYAKKTGRKAIVGTMASDSLTRRDRWFQYGCNAFDSNNPTSAPLSFWTEQDILHYIKKYDLPYCSVYGDIVLDRKDDTPEEQINFIDYMGCYEEGDVLKFTGCDRTGCIFCMFGCHLEKGKNRFQRLKETHPRQYDYCINGGEMVDGNWQPSKEGLGMGKVLDYIGVKYD